MVILVKVLFIIASGILGLIGVISIFLGDGEDRTFGFFALAIAFFFLMIGIKYDGTKKGKHTSFKSNTKSQGFARLDINRIVTQVLESIEICQSTKNIDTLLSRLNFLDKVFKELLVVYNAPKYRTTTLQSIDNYKQLYYNKELTEHQLNAVTNPPDFEYESFKAWSLYNCFRLNFEFQIAEAEKLKTQRGKLGRYNKLLENLETTKNAIKYEYSSIIEDELLKRLKNYENQLNELIHKP